MNIDPQQTTADDEPDKPKPRQASASQPLSSPLPAARSALPHPQPKLLPPSAPIRNYVFMVLFLVGMLGPIMGAVVYLLGLNQYHLLQREGQPAEAVVTRLEKRSGAEFSNYYAYYEYTLTIRDVPTQFKQRAEMDEAAYQTLQEGQTIQILYVPSNPEIAYIQGNLEPPGFLLPGLLAGLGFTVIVFDLWSLRLIRRYEAKAGGPGQNGPESPHQAQ